MLYFSRAANTFNNCLSSVPGLYIVQRETNYPRISSCAVKRKPCAPVAVRNQLSRITYLLEIHSYICHRIPDVDSLNMLTPPHLWGGWTRLTPAGFIQDDSWLVSAWRMGGRAPSLLLPLRCFPPEHLHCKQEQTPSSSSEWRDNSLLLSASAKGDGYLARMKIKDGIKFYKNTEEETPNVPCLFCQLELLRLPFPGRARCIHNSHSHLQKWKGCWWEAGQMDALLCSSCVSKNLSTSINSEKYIGSFLQTRITLFNSAIINIFAVYESWNFLQFYLF